MSRAYDVKNMETQDIIRDLGEFTESGNDSYVKQLVRELSKRTLNKEEDDDKYNPIRHGWIVARVTESESLTYAEYVNKESMLDMLPFHEKHALSENHVFVFEPNTALTTSELEELKEEV